MDTEGIIVKVGELLSKENFKIIPFYFLQTFLNTIVQMSRTFFLKANFIIFFISFNILLNFLSLQTKYKWNSKIYVISVKLRFFTNNSYFQKWLLLILTKQIFLKMHLNIFSCYISWVISTIINVDISTRQNLYKTTQCFKTPGDFGGILITDVVTMLRYIISINELCFSY